MRRILAAAGLCIVLAGTPMSGVMAAGQQSTWQEELIQEEYKQITTYKGAISVSGGTAICKVQVNLKKKTSVTISMTLQKKAKSGWSSEKTWSKTEENQAVTFRKTKSVSSKGTYRLKYSVKTKNDSVTGYAY